MKRILIALLFSVGAFAVQAQTSQMKIGYVDVDQILAQMPEGKEIDSELRSLNTQLQNQLQAKIKEYQDKVQRLQENNPSGNLPEAQMNELAQMEQNIQQFQQSAQQSMERKRNELMEPVFAKIGNAIETVAKANGYTHVLNGNIGGMDIVLYARQDYEISNLVLKELGVTPSPNR